MIKPILIFILKFLNDHKINEIAKAHEIFIELFSKFKKQRS